MKGLEQEFVEVLRRMEEKRKPGQATVHGVSVRYEPPRESAWGETKPLIHVDVLPAFLASGLGASHLDLRSALGFEYKWYFKSIRSAAKYAARFVSLLQRAQQRRVTNARPKKKDKKEESKVFYRGTRSRDPTKGYLRGLSFTSSFGVALIYSANPGDVWSIQNWKPAFVEASSVSAAKLDKDPMLDLGGTAATVGDVLRALKYEKGGITHDEALKIYNYLHNRLVGKAKGGDFKYVYLDEDGEPGEWDVPLMHTIISWEARDDFDVEYEPAANRLVLDSFVLADTPIVQTVAARLGFKSIGYDDIFGGGEEAAKVLLGLEVEDLQGVRECRDLEWEDVHCHDTVRMLPGAAVDWLWTKPSEEIRERILAEFGGR